MGTGIDMMQPGPTVDGWTVVLAEDAGERWWLLVRSLEEVPEVLREHEIGWDDTAAVSARPWTMHEHLNATCGEEGEERRVPLREAAEMHARDLAAHRVSSRCFCSTLV